MRIHTFQIVVLYFHVMEILDSRHQALQNMVDIRPQHILPLDTALGAYQGAEVTNGSHDSAQITGHLWHELVAAVTSPHDTKERKDVGMVQLQPRLELYLTIGCLYYRDRMDIKTNFHTQSQHPWVYVRIRTCMCNSCSPAHNNILLLHNNY